VCLLVDEKSYYYLPPFAHAEVGEVAWRL